MLAWRNDNYWKTALWLCKSPHIPAKLHEEEGGDKANEKDF